MPPANEGKMVETGLVGCGKENVTILALTPPAPLTIIQPADKDSPFLAPVQLTAPAQLHPLPGWYYARS